MNEESKEQSQRSENSQEKDAQLQRIQRAQVMARADGTVVGGTVEDQLRLAKVYCDSGLLPKAFDTPQKVFVAMQFVYELGLKPMTTLRNICVINGTPSMWGDLPLRMVLQSGKCDSISEWFFDEKGVTICEKNSNLFSKAFGATCKVQRKGGIQEPIVRTFTVEDARQAGLWERNDVWKKYPKRMLQMRARSHALKDAFADCLMGTPIAEYDYNVIPETEDSISVDMNEKKSVITEKFGV